MTLLTPRRRALAGELLRFGVVGASGFVVDTAVVYAVKGLIGLYAAGLASYVVAATWTWLFNRMWTFAGRGSGPAWRQWLRFMAVNLSGFVLNRGAYLLLVGFSATCREYPVLAVAIGSVLGMFANYFGSRRLVFR